MIWITAAMAGSLTIVTQGTIERPLLHPDRERAFEQPDRKAVQGDGWFRLSSLTGVPRFVYLRPEDEVKVDPTLARTQHGPAIQLQLEAQRFADELAPQDLAQAKRAVGKLHKQVTRDAAGLPPDDLQRALDLGVGRLALVLAQNQDVEIRRDPDWLGKAYEVLQWSEGAAELPTFYTFGTAVAAELQLAQDPVAVVEALLAATEAVPGRDALVFTALDRGLTCCHRSRSASIALEEALGRWKVRGAPPTQVAYLQARLTEGSALRAGGDLPKFTAKHQDDRVVDVGILGGRLTVLQLWRTGQDLGSMHTTQARFPDVHFVTLAQQPDAEIGPWRASLRELAWTEATHLFTPEGAQVFDRFYVDQGPAWLIVGPDGRLRSTVLTDPDEVRRLLDEPGFTADR